MLSFQSSQWLVFYQVKEMLLLQVPFNQAVNTAVNHFVVLCVLLPKPLSHQAFRLKPIQPDAIPDACQASVAATETGPLWGILVWALSV